MTKKFNFKKLKNVDWTAITAIVTLLVIIVSLLLPYHIKNIENKEAVKIIEFELQENTKIINISKFYYNDNNYKNLQIAIGDENYPKPLGISSLLANGLNTEDWDRYKNQLGTYDSELYLKLKKEYELINGYKNHAIIVIDIKQENETRNLSWNQISNCLQNEYSCNFFKK